MVLSGGATKCERGWSPVAGYLEETNRAMAALDDWRPLSIEQATRLLSSLGRPWWIAGGWAIDLFLGRTTRPHGDVDIAMLRGDQPTLQTLLAGWDVHVAYDGRVTPWAEGDWLEAPRHQFWVRSGVHAPWALEVLLEDHRDDVWLFRRDPAITMPLDRFGRVSAGGVPYVCPEVALLYKAKNLDVDRNAADFRAILPELDLAARQWLRDALHQVYPLHPWIGQL